MTPPTNHDKNPLQEVSNSLSKALNWVLDIENNPNNTFNNNKHLLSGLGSHQYIEPNGLEVLEKQLENGGIEPFVGGMKTNYSESQSSIISNLVRFNGKDSNGKKLEFSDQGLDKLYGYILATYDYLLQNKPTLKHKKEYEKFIEGFEILASEIKALKQNYSSSYEANQKMKIIQSIIQKYGALSDLLKSAHGTAKAQELKDSAKPWLDIFKKLNSPEKTVVSSVAAQVKIWKMDLKEQTAKEAMKVSLKVFQSKVNKKEYSIVFRKEETGFILIDNKDLEGAKNEPANIQNFYLDASIDYLEFVRELKELSKILEVNQKLEADTTEIFTCFQENNQNRGDRRGSNIIDVEPTNRDTTSNTNSNTNNPKSTNGKTVIGSILNNLNQDQLTQIREQRAAAEAKNPLPETKTETPKPEPTNKKLVSNLISTIRSHENYPTLTAKSRNEVENNFIELLKDTQNFLEAFLKAANADKLDSIKIDWADQAYQSLNFLYKRLGYYGHVINDTDMVKVKNIFETLQVDLESAIRALEPLNPYYKSSLTPLPMIREEVGFEKLNIDAIFNKMSAISQTTSILEKEFIAKNSNYIQLVNNYKFYVTKPVVTALSLLSTFLSDPESFKIELDSKELILERKALLESWVGHNTCRDLIVYRGGEMLSTLNAKGYVYKTMQIENFLSYFNAVVKELNSGKLAMTYKKSSGTSSYSTWQSCVDTFILANRSTRADSDFISPTLSSNYNFYRYDNSESGKLNLDLRAGSLFNLSGKFANQVQQHFDEIQTLLAQIMIQYPSSYAAKSSSSNSSRSSSYHDYCDNVS
jgi:hypothetical protein